MTPLSEQFREAMEARGRDPETGELTPAEAARRAAPTAPDALREAATAMLAAAEDVNARYIGGSPIKGARFSAAIGRLAQAQIALRRSLAPSTSPRG